MAIDGRINVDVLFHDTDGTTSLKVVSLEDSTAYTTGKVAIVTGTCNTSTETVVSLTTPGYRDSSGQVVSFSSISRVAFQSTRSAGLFAGLANFGRSNGNVSVSDFELPFGATAFNPRTTAGTATFTLVLYGT